MIVVARSLDTRANDHDRRTRRGMEGTL